MSIRMQPARRSRTLWPIVGALFLLVVGILIGSSGPWLGRSPLSLAAPAQATPPGDPQAVAASLSQAFANVADRVLPSVVTITSERMVNVSGSPFPGFFDFFHPRQRGQQGAPREYRQHGLGSGVIVRGDGIIITANHVVEGAENVRVLLGDDREFLAEVVGTDPGTDVAVLRVETDDVLPAVPLGTGDVPPVGEWVLALGNPFAPGLRGSVTAGIVSAQGRQGIGLTPYENFIQTDAAINPGNSGGPLVNLRGELIGINTAIASRSGGYQGVGFAIPVSIVSSVLESILEHGRVERGWLGVYIKDLDESLRDAFGIPDEVRGGVLIQEVMDGSPADQGGAEAGDVIVELDGAPVADTHDLRFRVAATPPGDHVTLIVLRDLERRTLDVELGELDAEETLAEDSRGPDVQERMGFDVQALDDDLRQRLSLDWDATGVVVTSVERYSGAEEAGLREGDVIVSADRQEIESLGDLQRVIAGLEAGDVLLLRVVNESARRFVAVRIPE